MGDGSLKTTADDRVSAATSQSGQSKTASIYGQAPGVPSPPPPPMVWSGRGGGGGAGVCGKGGVVLAGGRGSHASPSQAVNPVT